MKRNHLLITVLLLAAMFLPGIASADVMLKQKNHTDSYQIMNNKVPAKDSIETIWMTKDGFTSDSTDYLMIFRIDKNIAYMINKKDKTYLEQSLNMNKAMNEAMGGKNMSAEEKKAMNEMMQNMMKFTLSIKETNETKKINKWSCRKYDMRLDTAMGPSLTTIWATQDIKIDQSLFSKYKALSMSLGNHTGLKDSFEKAQKEYAKIKGVPVLTTTSTTVMGSTMKSSVELLEYKDGKAPAGILNVPAGYRKVSAPSAGK